MQPLRASLLSFGRQPCAWPATSHGSQRRASISCARRSQSGDPQGDCRHYWEGGAAIPRCALNLACHKAVCIPLRLRRPQVHGRHPDFLPKDLRCLKQSSTRCIGPLPTLPSRLTRGRRTAQMPLHDGCRRPEVYPQKSPVPLNSWAGPYIKETPLSPGTRRPPPSVALE